mmetsp:Transcript_87741/g.246540  ORF Transcript_87741/g.246540 Transcript_87741/m.246540 type:complete len:402 (+) Transcript_87741:305-1510(+)
MVRHRVSEELRQFTHQRRAEDRGERALERNPQGQNLCPVLRIVHDVGANGSQRRGGSPTSDEVEPERRKAKPLVTMLVARKVDEGDEENHAQEHGDLCHHASTFPWKPTMKSVPEHAADEGPNDATKAAQEHDLPRLHVCAAFQLEVESKERESVPRNGSRDALSKYDEERGLAERELDGPPLLNQPIARSRTHTRPSRGLAHARGHEMDDHETHKNGHACDHRVCDAPTSKSVIPLCGKGGCYEGRDHGQDAAHRLHQAESPAALVLQHDVANHGLTDRVHDGQRSANHQTQDKVEPVGRAAREDESRRPPHETAHRQQLPRSDVEHQRAPHRQCERERDALRESQSAQFLGSDVHLIRQGLEHSREERLVRSVDGAGQCDDIPHPDRLLWAERGSIAAL